MHYFSATCKPFEPNIDFFYQNLDLGWKFPTLPWDKKERVSSKGDLYHLLVSDVHQNKKTKKKTQNKKRKTAKKHKKEKKKRKKKNQSIKNRKEQKENRKGKTSSNKQCLNHVQSCCKEKKGGGTIVTWLRHEGMASDHPFKLLTNFLQSPTLKSPIDP